MTDNSCPICFTCKPVRVVCSNKHRVCEECYLDILNERGPAGMPTPEMLVKYGANVNHKVNCPCPICRVDMNKLGIRGISGGTCLKVPERDSIQEKWNNIWAISSLGYEIPDWLQKSAPSLNRYFVWSTSRGASWTTDVSPFR